MYVIFKIIILWMNSSNILYYTQHTNKYILYTCVHIQVNNNISELFDVDTFDVTIDKGTLDAMLTGIDDDDTIDKLPTNIINLLNSITKITKTSFILISHTSDRK